MKVIFERGDAELFRVFRNFLGLSIVGKNRRQKEIHARVLLTGLFKVREDVFERNDVTGIVLQLVFHLHIGAGELHAPSRHAGRSGGFGFADEIVSDRPVNPQVNFGINQTGKNVLSADINHLLTVRQDGVFTDGDKLSVFYCNPAFDNPL